MLKLREFNCIFCGTISVDRSHTKTKKFCSPECAKAYQRAKKGIGNDNWVRCRFNEGVECSKHKCGECGWNPAVAKKRMEAKV